MKVVSAIRRVALSLVIAFVMVGLAYADFSGQFVVGNWAIGSQAFGCGSSSVDTSGAPASVTLNTGTGCATIGASFDYASAPSAGTVTVNFNYVAGNSGPSTFPAFYRVNGVNTEISNDAGASTQTGTATFSVVQGDTFGFLFQAVNSDGSGGTLTISNFTLAPAAPAGVAGIPSLGNYGLALLAAALALGGAFMVRRRRS